MPAATLDAMSKRKRASEVAAEHGRTKKVRAVSGSSIGSSSHGDGALVPADSVRAASRASAWAPDQDPEWTVKPPVGGRILSIDPVFTKDDQFFMVAYATKIKVFSRANGLCVRSLHTHAKSTVAAIALSQVNPSAVYAGLSSGRIELWDWTAGVRSTQWETGSQLTNLRIAAAQEQETAEDLVYVVEKAREKWKVTAHRLVAGSSAEGNELRTLYNHELPIESLYVAANGRIAVLHAGKKIIIGTQRGAKTFPLQSLRYTWRTFDCSDEVTAISAHVTSDKNPGIAPTVDVAVGTSNGVIFVYRDILNALIQAQQSAKLNLPVSRYHWHRNAVGALAWSRDGNYVISGGSETVLVLWQLDTNQKNFLPHLAATIHNIAISPSGSYYGLTLGDNSSLVLSALDFKSVIRVSEPQLHLKSGVIGAKTFSRVPRSVHEVFPYRRPPVDVVRATSRIVTASPSADGLPRTHKQSSASPFLQAIDHKNGQGIFKQALTRTNVTDRNIGPLGNVLEEPDVALLKVSADGNWLVTVDEWVPPHKDQELFEKDAEVQQPPCPPGLESHLKFWQWGGVSQRWELVWRVNLMESGMQDRRSGMILDLVEDESQTKFFTLAGDLVIKAWEPRQRTRRGLALPSDSQSNTTSWISYEVASLDDSSLSSCASLSARLAVSQDGSLLAAAASGSDKSFVGLFDLNSRKRVAAQSGLIHGPVFGTNIVGDTLVILADEVLVWDLVSSRWARILETATSGVEADRRKQFKHMALDSRHQAVAIAMPASEQKSRIAILKPQSQSLETMLEVPCLVRALVPSPNRDGFVIVNANSEIQSLASSALADEAESLLELPDVFAAGLNGLFASVGGPAVENVESKPGATNLLTARTQSSDLNLTEVLAGNPPLSMPPLMSIFRQVASTLSR